MATALVVPSVWPEWLRFRESFIALLDPACYSAAWLDAEIATGRMLLFTGNDSAIIANVRTYPTGLREFEGQAATGNLAEIVGDLIPLAEAYARQIGCQFASIASREGWAKVMKSSGYSIHQTTLRKTL